MTDRVILRGIVGSTAYGLATPESDIDKLGVFAADSRDFWGLNPPTGKKASKVTTNPDITYHEAGKFVSLCLKANPTVMELMWLPDELYEIQCSLLKQPFRALREHCLSAKTVRNSYLGYATQQFTRLSEREERGDYSFSSDLKKRTEKHARHLYRLLVQGVDLHRSGVLRIKLSDDQAENCRNFGKQVADGNTEIARQMLEHSEWKFDQPGVLPEQPDTAFCEEVLMIIRRYSYNAWFNGLPELR